MSARTKVFLAIALSALAPPAAAQAPAPPTTAFDGTYAGVSANVSRSISAHGRRCPHEHPPDPLTITNGVVRGKGSDRWTGTINAQGSLTVRNKRSMRVDAQ